MIAQAVAQTGRLVVIEEGSMFAGIGSEMIASVLEHLDMKIQVKRIAAHPVPIPAVKSLENIVLPDVLRIIREIKEKFQ